MTMIMGFAALADLATSPKKIVGPNACAECHKQETEAWKASHHFKTFREMPRRKEANEIAERMGIQRVRSEPLCLSCHYTQQQKDDVKEAVAGISCESCHGSGADWIKLHSGFSGKTEKTETKTEAAARWKQAEAKGMIRPSSLYELAKNCYSCHVVAQEDLVNKGQHPAGSTFELVTWSQGEVRHNTWTSKGKQNVVASATRKRMLYVVGLGVEIETGLRGVSKATARRLYAFLMARRVDQARRQLAVAAAALPSVPELAKIVELAHSAGLRLKNEQSLTSAADNVAKLLKTIAEKYDGSTMAALDKHIPTPDKFKGTAREANAAN